MRRADAPTDWEGFAERFPEMLAWDPGILDEWYRPETLSSDEARRTFVLPDPAAWRNTAVPERNGEDRP